MAIRVAVAGAKGRTGSHIVQGVLAHANMELVGAVGLQSVGGELAPGVRVTSPDELGNLLKEAQPQVPVDFTNAAAAVENVKIAAQQKVGQARSWHDRFLGRAARGAGNSNQR